MLNEGKRFRQLEYGIFLTPDPLEYVDGYNPYIYCGQNPWGKWDPLGLAEQELREREVDHEIVGKTLGEMHTSRVVKFTSAEYLRLKKEKGLSDKVKNALEENKQKDGSTSIVISFFKSKNGKLEVEYNHDTDNPSETDFVTKIEPEDKQKDSDGYKTALAVLQASSNYEKNEENVEYSAYFSGESKGNCNAAQTALNAATNSKYTSDVIPNQWGVDLLYPITRTFRGFYRFLHDYDLPNTPAVRSRHNINKDDLKDQFKEK